MGSMDTSITSPLLNLDHQVDKDIPVLENSAKGGWKSSIFIIGVEVAERFAYFGVSGNLITYLTDVAYESTATAAKNVNLWSSVATLLPFLGAFIADSYLGRFKTILFSSLIYVMGLIMLTLSVWVVPIRFQHVMFFLSLYLVAIGEGGHKPCVQTFGADQFDENNPEEKKAKSSFFNWWYFGICSGAVAAMSIVYYIQDYVGWGVGFGIPGLAMAFALVLFLLGRKTYRQEVPSGSPLTQIAQVFVAAYCKRHLYVSKDGHAHCCEGGRVGVAVDVQLGGRTLTRTNQFKCLDKATIVDEIDALSDTRNVWRLCSVTQVEEVKLLVGLLPIWLSCLMYALIVAQVGTFFTKQGSTMDITIGHNFRVPPASLQVFSGLTVILSVPVYDLILVPIARSFTGFPSGITMLQRIGIGLFLSVITMVVAALVEVRRVNVAREHGLLDQPNATVPITVWWLLPQYVIFGVSDMFAIIGLQELFYDQMPDSMRSIGSAAYLSIFGVGSLLSSVVISIVQWVSSRSGDEWLGDNLNRAHLDSYYWLLAGLSTSWLGVYMVAAKCFVYKKIDCGAPPSP